MTANHGSMRPETRIRALEAARLYQEGLTYAAIGQRFGVTRERVRQLVKSQGVDAALVREERKVRAVFMAERHGADRVAERLGLRALTVHRWCRDAGVEPKRRESALDAHPWEEIQRRYLRGESPYDLAAAYGLFPQTVARRLHMMGTPMRGRSAAQATRKRRRQR